LLGFYRILLGQERALAVASRELRRPVDEAELNLWLGDEGKLEALFLGEIAETATPMVVHSLVTAREIQMRHGITPVCLPFSIYRPWRTEELTPAARQAARTRLNLEADEVCLVTFGYVHSSKAPDECVWALELLRSWGVPARMHFVGSMRWMPEGGAGLQRLIAELGLTSYVRFADDYVPEQTYNDYLVGADLAIQLRTYGLGGLSGALLDCAAAGLPTVTNAALAQAVGVPTGYVRSIPDALSPLLLAEALADLLDSGLTTNRAEDERREYSERRSFAAYAVGLCHALGIDVPTGSTLIGTRNAA
jgi:glycosyltransferase involved in cell wall biosynthesis